MNWIAHIEDLEAAIAEADAAGLKAPPVELPESLLDGFCVAEQIICEVWEANP